MDDINRQLIEAAYGAPSEDEIAASRQAVTEWLANAAPQIVWDAFDSPLGTFYVAATARGICNIVFGKSFEAFMETLDPLAATRRDPAALAEAVGELKHYFDDPTESFDLPIDISTSPPFYRQALQVVSRIPAGTVWTYKQVAEAMGRPKSSRAVGQAMARNPVPIIIPCHRVVGSNGRLTGYGGGGGIPTKRRLLEMEGAL